MRGFWARKLRLVRLLRQVAETAIKQACSFRAMKFIIAVMAVLLLAPAMVFSAELSSAERACIDHLLAYLKTSGCDFNRNGEWYKADEAVKHLNKKYAYLLKKGLVSTAEDFIVRAASESSMSGKPYQVRCGSNPPELSGAWLTKELRRFRQTRQ